MSLINRLRLAYQRRQAEKDIAGLVGAMIHQEHDPIKIFDGINYALPILLPDSLREDLETSGTLEEFITESYATAVRFQFDAPYKTDQPFTPVTEDPLSEWSWSTRKYVLEQCHAAYNRNPDAKVAVNHIANFATGEGFNLITYHPEIEILLDEFIEHNRIREYERQASKDLLIDGELVARYVHDGDMKQTTIVPLRPWELESIKTALGNYRDMKAFNFQFHKNEGDAPDSEQEYVLASIDADEILFVAINNRSYELRGRSDIYAALPWLKARKDWLENRARINYWLSVILWRVSVDTNNPAIMAAVRSRWATPPKPGSIAVEHANVQVEAMQASPNAPEAADDGRQLLMQIAKNFGLPEYFLGDGENSNLASATRQQLPALVRFEEHQRVLIMELWKPMFKKVIELAVESGTISAIIQKHDGAGEPIPDEMIAAECAFDVEYSDIMQDDILQLTQALEKQVQNEFTSTRAARTRLGNDPDQIETEIKDEQERAMRDVAQGRIPRDPVMRGDALTGEPANNREEQQSGQQVPVPA